MYKLIFIIKSIDKGVEVKINISTKINVYTYVY